MQSTAQTPRNGRRSNADRQIRRIVVPLDGTDNAERVLPYVQFLSRWFRADVTLLHVLFRAQRPQSGPDSIVYPDSLHDRAHSLATEYLAEIGRKLAETGLSPRTVVVAGDPVRVIAAHATHDLFELTAMGTNARSLLSRMWRESVFERLLASSRVPLFVVNARLNRDRYNVPSEPRGLLVALDGTGVARRSIPYAISLARAGSLRVTLLHVVRSRRGPIRTASAGNGGPAGQVQDVVARRLEAVAAQFKAAGVAVTTEIRYGPPAHTIVEVQNELGGHIAVIASRVRRGWRRTVFGSVLDRVIRTASDPLLVVPVRGWRQRDVAAAESVAPWPT